MIECGVRQNIYMNISIDLQKQLEKMDEVVWSSGLSALLTCNQEVAGSWLCEWDPISAPNWLEKKSL